MMPRPALQRDRAKLEAEVVSLRDENKALREKVSGCRVEADLNAEAHMAKIALLESQLLEAEEGCRKSNALLQQRHQELRKMEDKLEKVAKEIDRLHHVYECALARSSEMSTKYEAKLREMSDSLERAHRKSQMLSKKKKVLKLAVMEERAKSKSPRPSRRADPNPDAQTPTETPLFLAAKAGDEASVKSLLAGKADVHHSNELGRTPAFAAACEGHADCLVELLKSSANVNSVDMNGVGLLHLAAENGHRVCVKFLLENKADINQVHGEHGAVPAGIAAHYKNNECLKELIEAKADVNIVDNFGFSALKTMYQYGNREGIRILQKRMSILPSRTRYRMKTDKGFIFIGKNDRASFSDKEYTLFRDVLTGDGVLRIVVAQLGGHDGWYLGAKTFGCAVEVWKHAFFAGSWSWEKTGHSKGGMNLVLKKGPGLTLHKKHTLETCFVLNPKKNNKDCAALLVVRDQSFSDRKKGSKFCTVNNKIESPLATPHVSPRTSLREESPDAKGFGTRVDANGSGKGGVAPESRTSDVDNVGLLSHVSLELKLQDETDGTSSRS